MRLLRPATLVASSVFLLLIPALAMLPSCGGKKSASSTAPPGPTPTPAPPPAQLQWSLVAGGFSDPVYLAVPPGDTHRLFIVEKGGTIRIIKDGTTLSTPFLDLTGQVAGDYEQGLLSMAFRPDYASSGRFYVFFTASGSGTVMVERFHVSGNPDVAVNTADETVLSVAHSYDTHHNGGQLQFGPDGMLYLSIGDGGGSGDPLDSGQDPSDLLGSILRINVNGNSGYTIPVGNPFANSPVWSYGLRNPWRFSFDRSTGDLYIGEVGQGVREEIDVATKASGGGRGVNFGWSVMEGNSCYEALSCDKTGLTMPAVDYTHDNNNSAVIGGYVYRGSAIPGIRGHYFYTDLTGRWLRSFVYSGGKATQQTDWDMLLPDGPMSFGEDGQGELYVMTDGGQIFKLTP